MLARRPEGVDLARELGLGDRRPPRDHGAPVWTRGALRPLPRSVMGVPADSRSSRRPACSSDAGLGACAARAGLPPASLDGEDVAVGELVAQRLGAEVVDRLVEPLLGGVYAGHARRAVRPGDGAAAGRAAERHGSLLAAAAAAPAAATDRAGVRRHRRRASAGCRRAGAPGLDVRTGRHGARASRRTPTGWRARRRARRRGPESCSRPTRSCSRCRPRPPRGCCRRRPGRRRRAGRDRVRLDGGRHAGLPRPPTCRAAGSGFLVPPVDGRTIKAATFSFAKWAWVRVGRRRRCWCCAPRSAGTARSACSRCPTRSWSPPRWPTSREATGLAARPVDSHVQRWGGGLPQYAVGHLDRVAGSGQPWPRVPGLAVCGAAYDGVGVPACIASAPRRSQVAAHRGRRHGENRAHDRTNAARTREINDTIRYTMWSVFRLATPLGADGPAATARPPRSTTLIDKLGGRRRRRSAASTTLAGCAPTPT